MGVMMARELEEPEKGLNPEPEIALGEDGMSDEVNLGERASSYREVGNLVKELDKSDIILLGVSRTSKTPTAIYLANKGYKTSNIPLINENSVPQILKKNPKITCVIGLNTEPERLVDIRKNRMNSLKETDNKSYTNLQKIKKEVEEARNTFKKYKWPVIDVTRKSVEETAASIIKIYEIYKQNG